MATPRYPVLRSRLDAAARTASASSIGQVDAGRLDHDLVTPSPKGGVVRAERPHVAVSVGDRRDLEVPGTVEQRLEVQGGVTERGERLRAGLIDQREQRARVVDPPDAGAATPAGGLQHQRVPERLRDLDGVLGGEERFAAPRNDLYPRRRRPAASSAIRSRDGAQRVVAGPDERDAETFADRRCGGIFGRRVPSGPQRIDGGGGEGFGERVGAVAGAIAVTGAATVAREGHHLVGSAQRGIRLARIGVEDDHVQSPPTLVADLASRADEAHGRVHGSEHRHPLEPNDRFMRGLWDLSLWSLSLRDRRRCDRSRCDRSGASSQSDLERRKEVGAGCAGEADGLIAVEADENTPGTVEHDRIDSAGRTRRHDRVAGAGLVRIRHDLEPAEPLRQPQASVDCEFRYPGGLEAQLDEARSDQQRSVSGGVVLGQIGGELTDGRLIVPPDTGQNLVRGPVEVHAVDGVGRDDGSRRTAAAAPRRGRLASGRG